jgi:glycosyltransferase involved in cell wall biosynthesis
MRIALLIYGSLETVSGGYLYDRKLVEYLRGQGDQVEIISIPWRNYAAHLTDNFSIPLFNRLRQLQIDALLQDELNHPSLFLLNRRLREKVHYPLVSIVHHLRSSEFRPKWQNTIYRLVEKKYLESVDALVFNSRATQETVTQISAHLNDKPCVAAYPAGNRFNPVLNTATIDQRAQQPGPLRIAFLGNLIPRKGLHTLLKALSSTPSDLWELRVIGSITNDPQYARHVQSFVSKWDLSQQVKFLGAAPDDLIAQTLAESHVMVVPSSYEGYGIVYLEGMSFGLPAIGTTAGGAREIITHGVDGFLINPGDVKSLQAHLFDLASNRQKLASMGQAAHRRFKAHPGWEETSKNIHKFLESVIQRG